jgi:hypothetical protein
MRKDRPVSTAQNGFLEAATAEIESHIATSGWDQRPTLFALVRSAQLAADDPDAAARLGLADAIGDALTPIEQEELPEGPLDEVLAQIAWPAPVVGCALSQEIVILPPSAESDLPQGSNDVSAAANHPERREARLVVAVLRNGGPPANGPGGPPADEGVARGGVARGGRAGAAMLRLRGQNGEDDGDLLTGADLAPNLVEALLATLDDG